MKPIPPISWIWGAIRWVGRLFVIGRDVDRLKDSIAQLEAKARPRPRDLKLIHTLYWGIPDGSDIRHAFCPACAAQGVYVPLSRRFIQAGHYSWKVDTVLYRCPKCQARFDMSSVEEGEALG